MTRHILVVDDDPAIRRSVGMILEDEGYAVTTAANGVEALERIREGRPRLVLLDLQMPEMDGWQLHRRLREMGLDMPIVYMTAGHRAQAEAERNQAAGYLAKPFEIDDLIDVVARFVPHAA